MKKIIAIICIALFWVSCNKEEANIQPIEKEIIPKENSIEKDIKEISVLIYEGHLHGSTFHYNTGGELLKRKYLVYFQKEKDGTWKQVLKGNSDEIDLSKKGIPALGGTTTDDFRRHQGARYSFEVTYYDENGKELNSKIAEEEDYYQTFFTADSYHPLYEPKSSKPTAQQGTELFQYTYRDTNPTNKMIGDGVELRKKPIGFKGYIGATKYEISYNFTINLFEWNSSTKKGDDKNFSQLPENGEDGKTITSIQIPMDVITYLSSTDKGIEEMNEKFAKYFGVSVEEFKESEEHRAGHDMSGYFM